MEKVWEFTENGMTIYQFLVYEDNFSYLLKMENSLDVIAIDPGDAERTLTLINEKGLSLKAVLITHAHNDHVQGVHELKSETGCLVIGSSYSEFEEIDQDVGDGEECSFGPFHFQVIGTPGHTDDSQGYLFPEFPAFFSGDTLFLGGSGRLFEGTVEEMYTSLKKIAGLLDHTRLFCGHDYYAANLEFALMIEPQNEYVQKQLEVHRQHPITSTTLYEDKLVNPFLRLSDEKIHIALGFKELKEELEVLKEIRSRRNQIKI